MDPEIDLCSLMANNMYISPYIRRSRIQNPLGRSIIGIFIKILIGIIKDYTVQFKEKSFRSKKFLEY